MTDQVFISYSRKDRDYVLRLAEALRARGFSVWNDSHIDFGDRWWQTIVGAIRDSGAMIVIMTPEAEASEWVEREIQLALSERVPVFPLLLRGKNFPLLITRQYAKVTDGELPPEGFFSRLERALRGSASPAAASVGEGDAATPSSGEPEMVPIPAGEFTMGSDPRADAAAGELEQPQHVVHLPAVHLSKTPVTNDLYLVFVRDAAYPAPGHWQDGTPPVGRERHPVVGVTWHDADAYCRWLSELTGKAYSLPSEAQWEKGARGSDRRIYPWGDGWDPQRCNTAESGRWSTTPVDAYPGGASPYGLLDVAGNVWEWTGSLCTAYPCAPDGEQDAVDDPGRRVLRGGSFGYRARYARCAYRLRLGPDNSGKDIGFRVALAPAGAG
jgi:formylglycine-generating enzyme required for sulfatase activity